MKGPTLSIGPNNILGNLRGQVLSYFEINIENINEEQRILISNFCEWLEESIVFDNNDKKWKYKNMSKSERGSFTFPMCGDLSLPHLERGGDKDIPYLIFDFDAFDRGFLNFTSKLGIKYEDPARVEKELIEKFAREARECLDAGDYNGFFEKTSQGGKFIENNPRKHRSASLEFLSHLGLDYGSDDEGCTTVPVEYIKF